MSNNRLVAIYQADNGAIELPVDATDETIWATQKQIAEVFGVTPQNITMHIKAIYSEGEMDKAATHVRKPYKFKKKVIERSDARLCSTT